jgi:protein Hikeshi
MELCAGVSIEPVQELIAKEEAKMGAREDFAKRVAFNLFRFIESFGGRSGDQITVPTNVLDLWFTKFQAKFRRDPDFLARQATPI